MAKDPAVLFYTSDFLTGTMTMSNEQKGKYITLLCLQHQKTTLTKKDMLNICVSYDKDIFSKFKQVGDDFFNERMRLEHEKRSEYSKSRSKNRKKQLDTELKDQNNICYSHDKHMESANEDYNTPNLYSTSISLNREKNNLKNGNNKNIGFGEINSQGEDLSPFAIKPPRPLSDFIGEVGANGKVIG